MYNKFIFFSATFFSLYNYTSHRALAQKPFNSLDMVSQLEREVARFSEHQATQEEMYFYTLPSRTNAAQEVIPSPLEIAQGRTANAHGYLAKIKVALTFFAVESELKLSFAQAAHHGHFPNLAQQDSLSFAKDFESEINQLLHQFEINNKDQKAVSDNAFDVKTKKNQKILMDVNTILANLSTIDPKTLKTSQVQTAIERALEDIESKLKRQLELNKASIEQTLKESSDIAKILHDLKKVRSMLCTEVQSDLFRKLYIEFEKINEASKKNTYSRS